MKKLFISVPMKGRTEENIRKSYEKMHKMAELVFDEELEVISTFVEDKPPKDSTDAIWYLGESIKKMAEADCFIGINYTDMFKGCNIERTVATDYGLRVFFVNCTEFFPDIKELERMHYENIVCSKEC